MFRLLRALRPWRFDHQRTVVSTATKKPYADSGMPNKATVHASAEQSKREAWFEQLLQGSADFDAIKSKCSGEELSTMAEMVIRATSARPAPMCDRGAETAVRLWKDAYAKGHLLSAYQYAAALRDGRGVAKNLPEAFTIMAQAARSGNGYTQLGLALMYLNGEGTAADPPRAVRLLQESAKQGVPEAMFQLSELYATGQHVDREPEKAMQLLQQAADKDHAPAAFNLAKKQLQSGGEQDAAFANFRKAAQHGLPHAAHTAGVVLMNGENGVKQDVLAALDWFAMAAKHRFVPSMINLAMLYKEGRGVPKSEIIYQQWLAAAGGAEAHLPNPLPPKS
eukprot:TRINITY_DN15846_c0_g1_i1.p1 TRINITY_DN15846_c0_g1~~TRINITY_DN15846_c0_g1_i1.p1  ORF type:complete len:337 (+),score=68.26 TRINITY_DN15846_c0_g1_i1:23-1033(+)